MIRLTVQIYPDMIELNSRWQVKGVLPFYDGKRGSLRKTPKCLDSGVAGPCDTSLMSS